MYLLKFVFLIIFSSFAFPSETVNYLNTLSDFYRDSSFENFVKLEQGFEKINDKHMKSKISFILASSAHETQINNKSYYALYALKFYKGKDVQMLEDSYLQVITIFYYQKNLIRAKQYLEELLLLKNLSPKTVMISRYYRGLIYASEKDYVGSINYWLSNMPLFVDGNLSDLIYQEIGRSYLLENTRKAYQIGDKKVYQNPAFIKGVHNFSANIDNETLLKILTNLEKEDQVKYFAADLLSSSALLDSKCKALSKIEFLKKNGVRFSDYFNLLKYCSSDKNNHDAIYKMIKTMVLEGEQKLFRAYVNDKGNNCLDYIDVLKTGDQIAKDNFIILANGIIKDCSLEIINQNHQVIAGYLLDSSKHEESGAFLFSFLSNSNIKNDISSSEKFEIAMKGPEFNQIYWESFGNKDQDFIAALNLGRIILRENLNFVIKKITSLQISDNEKYALAKKIPSGYNAEEIVKIIIDKSYAAMKLPTKNCLSLGDLEKEIYLRFLIEKEDTLNLQKNYNCFLQTILVSQEYQEIVLRLWIASSIEEMIDDSSSYSLILNYISNEKKQDDQPELPNFGALAKVEELKEIAILRDLKSLNLNIGLIKKIEKARDIILSIKKYNGIVANYSWSSANTGKRAIALFNRSVDSLKNKIAQIDNSPNTNILVQRLGEWEIKI